MRNRCKGCGMSQMRLIENLQTDGTEEPEYKQMFEGREVMMCPSCGYTELAYAALEAEVKRLKEALLWLKTDLREIKAMNEPTFFTICQRWMPHIDQALKGDPK